MKKLLTAAAILALAACGKDEAPKPEAKAPEAPQSDPNTALASRVKRALEEADLIGIDPSASGGKVTLFGTTPTDAERKRAAGIATKVEGVTSVDNQIKVVKGS